jgi:hypothetical protein
MKRTKNEKSFFDPKYPGRGAYEITFDTIKAIQFLLVRLRVSGTVAEITAKKIDPVKQTIEILKNDFPDRARTVSDLEEVFGELEKIRSDAKYTENALAEEGWKIDPKTGRPSASRRGTGEGCTGRMRAGGVGGAARGREQHHLYPPEDRRDPLPPLRHRGTADGYRRPHLPSDRQGRTTLQIK